MTINQAVIFCGGRGERLRPLTDRVPKPVVPVNGVPFLDYLLKTVYDAGIKKVLLLAGYRHEALLHYVRDGVEWSVGTEEDLTGRRLLNAYSQLDDHFLLMYGDNYWPIELEKMEAFYMAKNLDISTTIFSNKDGTGEYGAENNVESQNGLVVRYDKSRKSGWMNGVDIGYFLVKKESLAPYLESSGNFSFEEVILANKARIGQVAAYVTDRQYYWITDIDSLRVFEKAAFNKGFKPINWRQ